MSINHARLPYLWRWFVYAAASRAALVGDSETVCTYRLQLLTAETIKV